MAAYIRLLFFGLRFDLPVKIVAIFRLNKIKRLRSGGLIVAHLGFACLFIGLRNRIRSGGCKCF